MRCSNCFAEARGYGSGCGSDALHHRRQMLNVRRLVAHAHRHDHLMVAVHRHLAVVALDVMAI